MKKSTIGLLTTAIVGGVGLTYAMSDKRMRNKLTNDSKKMLDKAGKAMSKIDMF